MFVFVFACALKKNGVSLLLFVYFVSRSLFLCVVFVCVCLGVCCVCVCIRLCILLCCFVCAGCYVFISLRFSFVRVWRLFVVVWSMLCLCLFSFVRVRVTVLCVSAVIVYIVAC